MRVAVIIPARYASTRLEGKPLADILGKPMVQWVYEQGAGAKLSQTSVVATDDERVLKAVESFGGRSVMTSSTHTSGTDRVAEAARGIDAGIIVNLQGDEPLIRPRMIDAAIRPLLEDSDILVSTLKTKIASRSDYLDPNIVKVVTDKDGFALYFSRSPVPYERAPFEKTGATPYKHIGIYVYRKSFLELFTKLEPTPLEKAECLEQMRILENGFRIKVVETEHNPISVDTPEDLEKVREIFKGR